MSKVRELFQRATIASVVEQRKREEREDKKNHWWSFNGDLYVNPSAKCPWCGEWVETKRIWLLDESGKRIRAAWDLRTRERLALTTTKGVHPHMFDGGAICMGTSEKVSQAMFAGLTPGDALYKIWLWMENLGHECDFVKEAQRIRAEEVEEARIFGLQSAYEEDCECEGCRELREIGRVPAGTCRRCDRPLLEGQGEEVEAAGGRLCVACARATHFVCVSCERRIYGPGDRAGGGAGRYTYYGDRVCEGCFGEYYLTCEECDMAFRRDEIEEDDEERCSRCRA